MEGGTAVEYAVPGMQQGDLVKKMTDEERREAQALARKYAEIVWPRRILRGSPEEKLCRLVPQFAGDSDPCGADPTPR
ncbi:MAG TPA: hypothetical protein VKH41_12730 [Myxococcota bacterium]|nr:hypothetical protein [Myxococcota bacterium]